MPTWPTFTSTTLRTAAKQYRPPPRSDRAAMLALRWWYSWKRQSLPPDRRTSAVETVLAGLDQREQQAIDAWLAGSRDRDIGERLGMPVPLIAQIRFAVLAQVAARLAEPKIRKVRSLPDRDALDAQLRELEARMLDGGELDLQGSL